jgi:hypothetical protein
MQRGLRGVHRGVQRNCRPRSEATCKGLEYRKMGREAVNGARGRHLSVTK